MNISSTENDKKKNKRIVGNYYQNVLKKSKLTPFVLIISQ
jgi:hypothetical protein